MALRRHRCDLAEISTRVLPWPEWLTPSLAWEELSAEDRRALTELLVDKIVVAPHPHKIDEDGRRHYTIRAIPYQEPQQEAERLKAVHESRVKIVPRV